MPKRFPDRAIVRFPPGLLVRLDAVLKLSEDRPAFILAATAAARRVAQSYRLSSQLHAPGRNPL